MQKSSNLLVFPNQVSSWKQLPPLSHARWAAAAAVLGDEVVVCGGYGEDVQPLGSAECFNHADCGQLWVLGNKVSAHVAEY